MLTKFAIKKNVLTISIVAVMIISGIMAFRKMPRDDMPPFLIRYVSIVTLFSGASPDRVENLVTDKIEKVVQEVPEVDFITSESRSNISIITVSIKENEDNLQPIFDNIRRKVDSMKHTLPEGTEVTVDDEIGDVFGIILGITAEGYSYAEMKEIADEIRDGLIKLPNAAKVVITGYQDERIFVEFDNARLAELGLTMEMLHQIISSTNIVFPGGDIVVGERRLILEPTGSFETIDDLKNTIVSAAGSKVIRLSDVAEITRGYEDPRQRITRINGEPGLAVGVNLKKGGNIIELGREVDEKVREYLQVYPWGVEIQRVSSSDEVVKEKVADFMENLIQAVVVVLAVMLVFMGFRTGMVVASLIPVTMVMTFVLMSAGGTGLNQVTLASLIIALGMLVDNAIVITEAIMNKMKQGETPRAAAVSSSRELLVPLLTSSLTTSAAFMAFYLADSVMGEIMGNLFVVVTIALLSSWLLSMTLIPLLCIYALKPKEDTNSSRVPDVFDRWNEKYKKILAFSLDHSAFVITAIIVLFIGAVMLFGRVPFIFMPKSDRPLVTANIELPLGTRIERTAEVIADIEGYIVENLKVNSHRPEGIVTWSTYVGEGAPKYDLGYNPPETSPNAAHILMNTSSEAVNDSVIARLDEYIYSNYPEAVHQVSRLLSGGGSADPIAVRISGRDPQQLYALSDVVKENLAAVPGTKNIDDDWGIRSKKIRVDINTAKAQTAGISNQDIAVSLQTSLSGAVTGYFREGDEVIPIIMRNNIADNMGIDDLESINIYAQQTGKSVPLKQVADAQVEWQAAKILRRDLYKTITVTADVRQGYTAAGIVADLQPRLKEVSKDWGPGYNYALGGEAEESRKAMSAVTDKLPMSMFIIVLLLVGQFNSIRKPVIILLTIPLGLIGVIPGLWITGSYFGFMAFLGVISLAGVVINNAIVLIDRIQIEIEEFGLKGREAIISAGYQRFRPILLTTATTSLGLLPLWFGGGTMWEPMAVTIIFGLIFATVLTLIFIPVMYRVLFRVE